jgi:hypothetical protein
LGRHILWLQENAVTDRSEHVEWCKARAREYIDQGDLANAVSSMMSDMGKREDTAPPMALVALGMMAVRDGDRDGVRRFVEGFN